MNLDSDVRAMQPGDYRKLTNGSPIAPSSSAYENAVQDVVCDVVGNQIVSNTLPSGTKKVVGVLEDRANNRAFYAVANSTAANNAIYKFENGTISLVMQSAILDFALTDFVDMDIVGDILIFTNGRSEIKKINIVKAAAGDYTLASQITLIKPPPLLPLTWELKYDNSTDSNFIAGNYFQFYFRYIYEDNDYSVFSPCSKTSNGWAIPSDGNTITVKRVHAKTETFPLSGLLYQIDGNSVYVGGAAAGDKILILSNGFDNGVWVASAGTWSRDSSMASGTVNANTKIFVLNGNTYARSVFKIKQGGYVIGTDELQFIQIDGPNYITITNPLSTPANVKKIEYAVRVNGSNELIVYREEFAGSFSTNHDFYNRDYLFTVPDSDSFVWNDNVPLKSKSIKIFKNRVFTFNNTEGYEHSTNQKVSLSTFQTNNFSTLNKTFFSCLNGGNYSVGIVYTDLNGRNSSVKNENTITIPRNLINAAFGEEFIYDAPLGISINTAGLVAPSWATHFRIMVTKAKNVSFFLNFYALDIYHYYKNATGGYVFNKRTASGFFPIGAAIDISTLSIENKGYTWSKGDRVKIRPSPIRTTFDVDTEILGQEGRFIFTRVLSEISSSTIEWYEIIIYSPKNSDQEPFYEVGLSFPIASLGGSFNWDGDVENMVFWRYDKTPIPYNATDPYAQQPVKFQTSVLQRMNVWDRNYTTWVTQAGRSLIKSDSRQISKYTSIRFGQQYIVNSNVFGLNTFYALDEYAMPIENGIGTRLAPAGKVLVAIHQIETTALYIGEGFVNTTNQNNFLAKTDSVIGDDQKYLGGYGTLHPESVVAREGRVYYLDMRKGVVVRRSQDGLTPISEYGVKGLISTLCNVHAALGVNSQIRAGWDPQYDCYCLSFVNTSNDTGYTLYWHERSNGWVFITDMRPEMWGLLGQRQLSFRNGELWQQALEGSYNSFFGVQYDRTLEMEFSPLRSLIHIWDAIEVDVENIYTTAGTNEDVVLLYQKNGGTVETKINYLDFRKRESDRVWRSSFFRWINDVNYGSPVESKYKSSHRVRGQSAFLVLKYKGTDRNPMKSVTIFYTPSMQSTP